MREVARLQGELRELNHKFYVSGEIDGDEYRAQKRELDKKLAEANRNDMQQFAQFASKRGLNIQIRTK